MRKRRETQKKLPFLPSFYRWLPMRQVHRSSVDYRPILPDGRHCSQYHWLIWETNKALLTLLKCFANTPHALAKIRPRPVQNVFSISSQHSYSKGDRAELIQISDLKLFPIKGAPCEGNETCFLYKGVSYLRVITANRKYRARLQRHLIQYTTTCYTVLLLYNCSKRQSR